MKLIDPKQAKEFASTFFGDPILQMAANAVLDNVPTIEAEPVVHGRWILPTKISGRSFNIPHCSACNGVPPGVDENTKYCAHCGARMDGGQNETLQQLP